MLLGLHFVLLSKTDSESSQSSSRPVFDQVCSSYVYIIGYGDVWNSKIPFAPQKDYFGAMKREAGKDLGRNMVEDLEGRS